MRLLFFTDAHLAERPPIARSPRYCADIFAKLAEVKVLAAGCDASIFGGDLLHWPRPTDTSHRLVRRLIEFFRDWPVPLYVVLGNHEQTPESLAGLGRTALGVLLEALRGTRVQLLDGDEIVFGDDGVAVQLSAGHWTPSIDGDPQALRMGPSDYQGPVTKVKAMHAMVMPPGDGHPFRCVTMDQVETDADVVLLGHTHWTTPPMMVGSTLYVGPGAIARTSRSAGEVGRQVQVAVLSVEESGGMTPLSVELVPLRSMRPADDVFLWLESKDGGARDGLFEGYVAALESGLDVEGLSVEDALLAMEERAPVGVVALARRYLAEAGL